MSEKTRSLSLTETALAAGLAASASLLAGAHLFEKVGGLAPCVLCLDQREAHWTALVVAIGGLAAARIFKSRLGAAAAVGAAALVYAVSAGLALYHTGVEYKYWPGPAICAGGGTVDIGSIGAALTEAQEAADCSDAKWRLFGISMAGYNLLVSAGLFALTTLSAIFESKRVRNFRRSLPQNKVASS